MTARARWIRVGERLAQKCKDSVHGVFFNLDTKLEERERGCLVGRIVNERERATLE